jgi:SpoVK/Ycf46/Vps4 family AAA+-type ATPase
VALRELLRDGGFDRVGQALAGSSLSAVESMVLRAEHRGEAIQPDEIGEIKKSMVEADADGLVELVRSERTLDDFAGNDAVKRWLRQDLALWRRGETRALPKGYLLCGPVGTGKTFLAECLAGEAGVPVVKIKNFRERWVGTTEGNLEKIFRLLQALGRVIVFVDEADQTLGRRGADGDSGLSGRVYSMIAQEMGRSDTRGRVIWILASSRPDLLEVDLKRPGRLDVKVPLYPTASADEGLDLLAALTGRWEMDLDDDARLRLLPLVPDLLTPAAAEALAFKAYRLVHADPEITVDEAYHQVLVQYRPSVPLEILELQIRLATEEATDGALVPERFRTV